MRRLYGVLTLFLMSFSFFYNVSAQEYTPGSSYLDSNAYVEYIAGNLPIILSAPHGGSLQPSSIPDRDCEGCVTINDAYTKLITEGIAEKIHAITACYPHVVINLLHRKKFDANRDIEDAADGNVSVEQSWYAYHDFIELAGSQIADHYDRGLFIDLHGHAHTIQRIELGYLMSREDLQESDEVLNSNPYTEESSIRTLVEDNWQALSHAELLRGAESLGTILDEKGFPAVPSFADPYPQGNEPFFQGGYNTRRHGSVDDLGHIDAIQIEMNQDIRFDEAARAVLIDSMAQAILEYYAYHYDEDFLSTFCTEISNIDKTETESVAYTISPNPAEGYFIINGGEYKSLDIELYNQLGQKLHFKRVLVGEQIDVSDLPAGYYILKLWSGGNLERVQELVLCKLH